MRRIEKFGVIPNGSGVQGANIDLRFETEEDAEQFMYWLNGNVVDKEQQIIDWLNEQIESINQDLKMDIDLKEAAKTNPKAPIPFGDNNEQWLAQIKERRSTYEECLAHIELKRMNRAIMSITRDSGDD